MDYFFIHPKHYFNQYQLKKARLFVLLPLTVIVIGLFCQLASNPFGDSNELPHIMYGTLACTIPLYLFRRYGNMVLSGNILTAIYAVTLSEAVFRTGGLYSDNLIWLLLAPMMAMLFSGKTSGFSWLVILLGFTYYIFSIEPGGPTGFRQLAFTFDNSYYLVSYFTLFLAYTVVLSVFVAGTDHIAKELIKEKTQSQLKTEEATQKADALEIAETRLLRKNKELELFASAASHDLREPLRMVKSYTQLLRQQLEPQLDDRKKEFFGYAIDGANRMEVMLNDLLDFARLGNEGEKAVPICLNHAVNQAMNNLAIRIMETSTRLDCEMLPIVEGAETQLVRLFQNLLSNSIKFARKEVPPMISITNGLDHQQQHIIYFKDNGIGIPEKSRERIFNVFERLHAKEAYEGSGIGLAACKKIVENLGGKITVESSAEGAGTTFKIVFPLMEKKYKFLNNLENTVQIEQKQDAKPDKNRAIVPALNLAVQ